MAPVNTGEQLWQNLQNLLASPSNEDPSGIFTATELVKLRMVYEGQTYEKQPSAGAAGSGKANVR